MKKIVLIILVCVLFFQNVSVLTYATQSNKYFRVEAEYSDRPGNIYELDLLINNEIVFVEAAKFSNKLGYIFSQTNEYIEFIDSERQFSATYFLDSLEIKYSYGPVSFTLEAPTELIYQDNTFWVPFEYIALVLNSSLLLVNDTVVIEMPRQTMIDTFIEIQNNKSEFSFSYQEDMNLSQESFETMGISAHLVSLFDGLITFESESWAQLFSFNALNTSYDKKYSEDLATFFMTSSADELNAAIEDMKNVEKLFTTEGKLGEFLESTSRDLDVNVGTLKDTYEATFEGFTLGNRSYTDVNQAYQAFENAFDAQSNFDDIWGGVLKTQQSIDGLTKGLDTLIKVAEYTSYVSEFTNQDEFSVDALERYLKLSPDINEGSQTVKYNFGKKINEFNSSDTQYAISNFLKDNIDELIVDNLPLEKILGAPASIALIAWDLMRSFIPFYSDGLKQTESFELSLYSLLMQEESSMNSTLAYTELHGFGDNINSTILYEYAVYAYTYLKFSYITRNTGLGSLTDKTISANSSDYVYQSNINLDIADFLVTLKKATENNDSLIYGFLPENNKEFLANYDDSKLIEFCEQHGEELLYVDTLNPLFNKILAEYKTALLDEQTLEIASTYPNVNKLSLDLYQPEQFFYAMHDINLDRENELLFGIKLNDGTFKIFDVYSIANDEVIKLFDDENLADKTELTIFSHNSIRAYIDGGENYGEYDFYWINDGGFLEFYGKYIYDFEKNPETPYFGDDQYYDEEFFQTFFNSRGMPEIEPEWHSLLDYEIQEEFTPEATNEWEDVLNFGKYELIEKYNLDLNQYVGTLYDTGNYYNGGRIVKSHIEEEEKCSFFFEEKIGDKRYLSSLYPSGEFLGITIGVDTIDTFIDLYGEPESSGIPYDNPERNFHYYSGEFLEAWVYSDIETNEITSIFLKFIKSVTELDSSNQVLGEVKILEQEDIIGVWNAERTLAEFM